MIVKIGGCNGSGKTALVQGMMRRMLYVPTYINGRDGWVEYYTTETRRAGPQYDRVVILGDYRHPTKCGMDTVRDRWDRYLLVKQFVQPEHRRSCVVMEGLLIGKSLGVMDDLTKDYPIPWLYVFLDTPYDVCVQRVQQRRTQNGNTGEFNPSHSMPKTYRSVECTVARLRERGDAVLMLDHRRSSDELAADVFAAVAALNWPGSPPPAVAGEPAGAGVL